MLRSRPDRLWAASLDHNPGPFLYQNHVAINVGFGFDFVRTWRATHAAAYEGAVLREGLLDPSNTARTVRADTAYRSAATEAFMSANDFLSRLRRKKPKG